MPYPSIHIEGGLLPSDIVDQIATADIEGQQPQDFFLRKNARLTDEIAGAWADDPGGVCSGFCLADGVAHTAKCVACEPTTVECVSLEQMRTCNGSGAWVTKNCVDETCHSNYGNKCGGECEQGGKTCDYNNNLPRTCTSSGKWQDAPAACQTRSIVARPS